MNVAVVIPSYNHSEFIGEAIESVLNQTTRPNQIVVTDDGSDDGTESIIRNYAKQYPNIIQAKFNSKNRGVPKNLNNGLKSVSADSVTFLAGDDRFRPTKIEKELTKLRSKDEIGVVYSNFAYVDRNGTVIDEWANSPPPVGDVLLECLTRQWPRDTLFRNPLVATELLNRIGLFDESLPIYEDWDMKIRLSSVTKIAFCDEILTEYRRHPSGISNNSDSALHARMFEKILEKHAETIESLSVDEQRYVKRKLRARQRRQEAFAALEAGKRISAVNEYLTVLRLDPYHILSYEDHLRILLPKNLFQHLAKTKQLLIDHRPFFSE